MTGALSVYVGSDRLSCVFCDRVDLAQRLCPLNCMGVEVEAGVTRSSVRSPSLSCR